VRIKGRLGHLAVEAVIGELISARLFPVLRENTAKFADFRPRDVQ
jgi:hypothetical protein